MRLSWCIFLFTSTNKDITYYLMSVGKLYGFYSERLFKGLHWLKVRERIRYKVAILAHKSFYETAPQYLGALVTRKDYVKNV